VSAVHELTLRQLEQARQERDLERRRVQRLRNGIHFHIDSAEIDCPQPRDLLDLLEGDVE
jgi:hypothetical protein